MAAERGDERLAALLAGPQPAVLRLMRATVEAAAAHGRWVGVCGELAGDPAAAVLLAGLGVTRAEHGPALDRRGQGGACARSISADARAAAAPRARPRSADDGRADRRRPAVRATAGTLAPVEAGTCERPALVSSARRCR